MELQEMPYRVDLAGSWGDHPFLNGVFPTKVISASAQSSKRLNRGGGLSGSTRDVAKKLFKDRIPSTEDDARRIFSTDNRNSYWYSGSQDSIGLAIPGVKLLEYDASYWPDKITNLEDSAVGELEKHLWLIETIPRGDDTNVLRRLNINHRDIRDFSRYVSKTWDHILEGDMLLAGINMTEAFYTRCKIMPDCLNPQVEEKIEDILRKNPEIYGHKLAGAGGGGYMIALSEKPVKGGFQPKIRR